MRDERRSASRVFPSIWEVAPIRCAMALHSRVVWAPAAAAAGSELTRGTLRASAAATQTRRFTWLLRSVEPEFSTVTVAAPTENRNGQFLSCGRTTGGFAARGRGRPRNAKPTRAGERDRSPGQRDRSPGQ